MSTKGAAERVNRRGSALDFDGKQDEDSAA
jgi:hypothetical protein